MLKTRRSASAKLTLCLLAKLRGSATRTVQHQNAEGNVLPLVLFTALVVTVGSVALMTRSSNSWLSSVSNSDYQAAKEAAETGFNRILAELNTNQKSHFLVTRFSNWYTSPPSTTEASSCNVVMPGVASPPSSLKTELAIGTGQFYQLTSYVSPERSPGSPDGGCTKFGNLFGGSADVVVTGTVERGGRTTSRFQLKKTVYVKGPFTESSKPTLSPLMVTGGAGSTLDKFNSNNFGLATTSNPANPKSGSTKAQPACLTAINCIAASEANRLGGVIDARSTSVPTPYPSPSGAQGPNSYGDNRSAAFLAYDRANNNLQGPYTHNNYPYVESDGSVTAEGSNPSATANYLANGCYYNNTPSTTNNSDTSVGSWSRPLQTRTGASYINCVIGNLINPTIKVNVNTVASPNALPVNLFIHGSTITLDANSRVNNSEPSLFQNLRIFGINNGSATDCNQQTIVARINSSPFDGAFVWLPNATFSFTGTGGGTGQDGSYGIRWVCKFTGTSSANTGLYGPESTAAFDGLKSIFPLVYNDADDDTFLPNPIPSGETNYRAYGVTY